MGSRSPHLPGISPPVGSCGPGAGLPWARLGGSAVWKGCFPAVPQLCGSSLLPWCLPSRLPCPGLRAPLSVCLPGAAWKGF